MRVAMKRRADVAFNNTRDYDDDEDVTPFGPQPAFPLAPNGGRLARAWNERQLLDNFQQLREFRTVDPVSKQRLSEVAGRSKQQVVANTLGGKKSFRDAKAITRQVQEIVDAHTHEPDRLGKIESHIRSVFYEGLEDNKHDFDFFMETFDVKALERNLPPANRYMAGAQIERTEHVNSIVRKPAPPCKTIAFFNNKGGVGKTTVLVNCAAAMAKIGFRVGVVDADCQGNASRLLAKEDYTYNDPEYDEADGDNMCDDEMEGEGGLCEYPLADVAPAPRYRNSSNGVYLHDKLSCAVSSKVGFESPLGSVSNIDIHMANSDFYELEATHVDNVFLLRGDHDLLSKIEKEMMQYLSGTDATRSNDGLMVGCFRVLLDRIAIRNNLDVILVDLGPSNTMFNGWLMMSCDYVLPPCFADAHSADSVQQFVEHIYPQFTEYQRRWVQMGTEHRSPYLEANPGYLFNTRTRVLPFTISNFSLRRPVNADTQGITQNYSVWIKRIIEDLKTFRLVGGDKFGDYLSRKCTDGEEVWHTLLLKALGAELLTSQRLRIPLIELTAKHLKGNSVERLKPVKRQLLHFANFLATKCNLNESLENRNQKIMNTQDIESLLKSPTKRRNETPRGAYPIESDFLEREEILFIQVLINCAHSVAETLKLDYHDQANENLLTQRLNELLKKKMNHKGFEVVQTSVHERLLVGDSVEEPDIIVRHVFNNENNRKRTHAIIEVKKNDSCQLETITQGNRGRHHRQVDDYMKAAKASMGILINFDKFSKQIAIFVAKEVAPDAFTIDHNSWREIHRG
jgi:cellulose biosynthesis protein BcsQ